MRSVSLCDVLTFDVTCTVLVSVSPAVATSLNRTVSQCQSRWQRTVSPSIKKGRWTAAEDKVSVGIGVEARRGGWGKVQCV